MDLRHLRYFVTVAEELHFGRAAEKLHISQPPLSQQIKALETELGVLLFDRIGRRVALTVAGQAFLVEARITLAQAKRAVVVARQAQAGEVGRLSVGFTSSMPFVPVFARAVSAYRDAFPQVRVELSEMITRQQIDALIAGQLNVAFVRSPLPELPAGLSVRPILRDGLVVLAHAEHRFARRAELAIAELQDTPLILMSPDAQTGLNIQLFALCADAGFSPRIAQYAVSPWTPIGLAALGVGIAIVHSSLVERLSVQGLAKVPLRTGAAVNEVYFAHFDDPSPAAREFARIVERVCEAA